MTVRIITKMLVQQAVYWPPASTSDQFGKPIANTPIQILCRWEDQVGEVMGEDSRLFVSKALVYVSQDVALTGVLWLGALAALTDPVNPFNNPGAYEIKRFDKLPTIKGDQFLRTAYL